MKKNLFTIDDSEKLRILEMHETATKKLYLNEQDDTTITSSTIGGVQIPGFLFSEDDKNWVNIKNKETEGKITQKMFSDENYNRIKTYYGASQSKVNPNSLIGKYSIMFNSKPESGYFKFQKANVINTTFKIGLIYKKADSTVIFITTGGPSNVGLNVRVPLTSTTSNIGNAFHLYNGNERMFDFSKPSQNGVFEFLKPEDLKTYKEIAG